VIHAACTITEPGTIYVASTGKGAILGEPSREMSGRVTMSAEALRAGAVPVEVTDRIHHSVWVKLVDNLASGPMSTLAQSAAKDLYGQPACLDPRIDPGAWFVR
jgi:2-dehydropantoate 2-reductase